MMGKIPESAFAAVIHGYLQSPNFTKLAASTQANYRHSLRLAELPECLGALSVDVIHPADVQKFLDALADRPGAQQCARVALKAIEKWAIVRRLLPHAITTGTELVGSKGGRVPWTDEQVEIAERHARPDIARIVTLASNTGQRGSDLIRMCPTDLETFQGRLGINVRQQKTGVRIWIPLTPALEAAMATWERRPGPFLRKANDQPWGNRHEVSCAWIRERSCNPELEPCSSLVIHGLRATAVVRLRRAGATTPQISDMVGMSEAMVARYCRFSAQRENAMAAVHVLDRTAVERTRRRS